MIKVHIGCGPIYLVSENPDVQWVNLDVETPWHYLAEDRPDLVIENQTTTDKYYKNNVNRNDIEKRTFHKQEVVVDGFGRAEDLPFEDDSLGEIRSSQLFEHFGRAEGRELLKHWYKKLIEGGKVHIDIPDLYGSAKLFVEARTLEDKKWAERLLYGSQKNEYGYHKAMYDVEMISAYLEDVGFSDIEILPNIHLNQDGSEFYPAFAVEGTK